MEHLLLWLPLHPFDLPGLEVCRLSASTPGSAAILRASSCGSQAGSAYIRLEDGYATARGAVRRALPLDANLGEAHAALGEIQMIRDWDWTAANASYQRAMELEPGNAGVLRGAGSLARFLGQLDRAVSLYRRAVELDPLQANGHKNLGMCLYYAGRHAEASGEIVKALEIAPKMAVSHNLLSQIYMVTNRPDDALAEAGQETHIILRCWDSRWHTTPSDGAVSLIRLFAN